MQHGLRQAFLVRQYVTLAAVMGALATPVQAQSTFGVVGGFVSSNISVSEGSIAGQKSRTGFAAGFSVTTPISKGFEFAPELIYVQKGVTADAGNGVTGAVKLSYVEVPLVFRYAFSSAGDAQPFVLAGPEIAMKVSCQISGSSGSTSVSQACKDVDPADEPKSVDYGLLFGVGLSVKKVSVTVRYDLGLANIRDNTSTGSSKNTALMVLLGIRF